MALLENLFGGKRNLFWVYFVMVTLVLVGTSYFVILYIYSATQPDDEEEIVVEDALSLLYVDYYENPDDYIMPESYIAMAEYQQQFPQPQGVQVLQGEDTTAIIGYMINYFSAGMGVDCSYCHSLENFSALEWGDPEAEQNRSNAYQHLLMTQELNREWLGELDTLTDFKQPSGAQIICATCHNGQAQPQVWPEEIPSLPNDFRLPLGEEFEHSVTEEGYLNVNARSDISLDTVQQNQYVMYHMNTSLGVGCTHCHNSRYFPSWEVPAKYYSLNMLQMTQHVNLEWGETLGGQQPSCNMCHQGEVIPPGSARSVDVLPAALVPEQ